MKLPELKVYKQHFDEAYIEEIDHHLSEQLRNIRLDLRDKRIGIAVGSRGIDCLSAVLKVIVRYIKEAGAEPILIPAMGSHGGGTPEGRKALLAHMGIDEPSIGAPLITSDEVVKFDVEGQMVDRIYLDRTAYECDQIILINRIKRHTSFAGGYESGLLKMAAIGLGGCQGASYYHRFPFSMFPDLILEVGQHVLNTHKVLMGIGIVENAYGRPKMIEVIPREEIVCREKELLIISKEQEAALPLKQIDILIVEEMGKNISGDGMDTKVIGRGCSGAPGFGPDIDQIIVLRLHDKSYGNALGVGHADFITKELYDSIDREATELNAITAGMPYVAMIPTVCVNEQDAFKKAATCIKKPLEDLIVVKIKNTKDLSVIQCSGEIDFN